MSGSDTPLLEVRNIEAGYGASQVLFGVSLSIAPHQVVSLMGRNGMGKSTTIKCITGALPVLATVASCGLLSVGTVSVGLIGRLPQGMARSVG